MTPEALSDLSKAKELIEEKKYPDAAILINSVLDDDPNSPQALYMLGFIAYEEGRLGMARALLKRCLDLGTQNAKVICLYGRTFQEKHDLSEAEAAFRRAMALDPSYLDSYVNLGLLYLIQGNPRKAIPLFDRALYLNPTCREAIYNKSLCNLIQGNFKEGWIGFEQILGFVKDRKERLYCNPIEPRWDGTPGKNVVAYGEQGIGDEISLASCIPDLIKKSNQVIIECDSRLEGLFKRSFPKAKVFGTRFQVDLEWMKDEKIDARVAFGSLPGFFRNSKEEFPGSPYLISDPQRRLQWKSLLGTLGNKPKIGIAWNGGSRETGQHRRRLTLEQLLPILKMDATFISLEYKDRNKEIKEFEQKHGIPVHHWDRALRTLDYDDTAGLVAELDLVIGVTTASLRLSAALGIKTIAMVPQWPIWFWQVRGNSIPWSKDITIYRQKGSWDSVISRVAYDLNKNNLEQAA